MSGAQGRAPLASYRDMVAERIGAAEPFDDVEESIDGLDGLTMDEKAALWLFAFSLEERAGGRREGRSRRGVG